MTIIVPTIGQTDWGPVVNTALQDLDGRLDAIAVNVLDQGAAGDGVTDDTAAIQAAINAAPIVYFPPGRVYLTGSLAMRSGTVLVGAGCGGVFQPPNASMISVIKLKNGTNASLITGADGVAWVRIRDLKLDGNKANNTSGDLINIASGAAQDTGWHIDNCLLVDAPHDGIAIGTGRQAVKTSRTWIMRSGNNGITQNGADGGLDTVLIGLSGANGIYIGAWVQHLTSCDIWSSGANGVLCDNVNMVSLISCGIDRHQQAGLVVQGGGAVDVIGCMFHSNSQAANNTYPHISITAGAVSVIATTFGYDALTNNPSWAIQPTGSVAVLEYGNRILTGSTVQGYISDPTKVPNNLGGNLNIPSGSQLNVGASGSSASVAILRAAGTDTAVSTRVGAETASRFFFNASGSLQWNSGSASTDVQLERGAANRLDLLLADLRIGTAGRGLRVAEGSNAKMGTATLTAGAVTVSTTAVTANSRIFLTSQSGTTNAGFLSVSTRTAGTSFAIASSNASDARTVAWMIVEPA
ncbi:glycosyl hydrolase family 28-related protein [Streptomyces canus]|uniref:glycosyl hydrolase family 28-related protein n=1 Tax=Streptomyces canus TaxID=58343 RepID=UPI003402408F